MAYDKEENSVVLPEEAERSLAVGSVRLMAVSVSVFASIFVPSPARILLRH
jgi:hypothetical protein